MENFGIYTSHSQKWVPSDHKTLQRECSFPSLRDNVGMGTFALGTVLRMLCYAKTEGTKIFTLASTTSPYLENTCFKSSSLIDHGRPPTKTRLSSDINSGNCTRNQIYKRDEGRVGGECIVGGPHLPILVFQRNLIVHLR